MSRRMTVGSDHETAVAAELMKNGWAVDVFGQQALSEDIRYVLKQRNQATVMFRWLPDFIATRETDVVLVDAKSGWRQDTRRHSIELNSLACLVQCDVFMAIPVFVVWHDLTANRANRLRVVHWDFEPVSRGGSDTPFGCVREQDQHPFEWAFGSGGSAPNLQAVS